MSRWPRNRMEEPGEGDMRLYVKGCNRLFGTASRVSGRFGVDDGVTCLRMCVRFWFVPSLHVRMKTIKSSKERRMNDDRQRLTCGIIPTIKQYQ